MPNETALSLHDTIAKAVTDSEESSVTAATGSVEQTGTEADASQTAQAEDLSKYEQQLLSDVETSGWTAAQRKATAVKFKSYDQDYHRKMAEISDLKRAKADLARVGVTVEDLQELALRKSGRSATPSPTVSTPTKEALKGIDRVIAETTDPAVREQLRESKRVLLEEVETLYEEKTRGLQDRLDRLESRQSSVRQASIDQSINELEDVHDYPPSLVEKYRTQLTEFGQKYPTLSMEDILFKVVPSTELKTVLKSGSATSASTTPAKRPATISSPAASPEDLSAFKRKDGTWNLGAAMRSLAKKVT